MRRPLPAAPSPHPGGHRDHADPNPVGRRLAVLTLGALGVVYGDIGSSPVYALRECFSHLYGLTPTPANVKVMPTRTSYFLGRERLLPHGTSPMARWRKRVFVLMSRNARSATEFFGLPSNRIVALAAQIEF